MRALRRACVQASSARRRTPRGSGRGGDKKGWGRLRAADDADTHYLLVLAVVNGLIARACNGEDELPFLRKLVCKHPVLRLASVHDVVRAVAGRREERA